MHTFLVKHALRHCIIGIHLFHMHKSPVSKLKQAALETLVIDVGYLDDPYVDSFEAFIPRNAQGTSGLHQSSWEGQVSGVLCPRLESLQIEGIPLTWLTDEEPELMAVLKDIVSLRAINGSPLKSFTFLSGYPNKRWELIGRDRSFIMEEVVPAQRFQLDI